MNKTKREKMAPHFDKNMLQTWLWVWKENQITRAFREGERMWDQPKMVVLQPNLKTLSSLHTTGRLMGYSPSSQTLYCTASHLLTTETGVSVAFFLVINSIGLTQRKDPQSQSFKWNKGTSWSYRQARPVTNKANTTCISSLAAL